MGKKKSSSKIVVTQDILVENIQKATIEETKPIDEVQNIAKDKIFVNKQYKIGDEVIINGQLFTNTSATTVLRTAKNEKWEIISIFNGKARYGIGKDKKVIAWIKEEIIL